MTDLGISGFDEVELVGRGAVGLVYKARQAGLDRLIAVKVFNGDFSDDRFQDFQRECRTLARVDWCPQIVTLYGTGVADSGYPYLAMEYCPGGSLADRVRRTGPLTEAEVRPVAKDVATALHIAHNAGVLHRDVKPANILISRSGSPVLCDFGIARFADALTSSVGVSATIAYAAPEVLLGKRATEASDIFSLGATLHALLTGRGPYAATGQESVQAILIRAALSDEELSVDQLPVSAGLRDVIARCLRRDPQERFASAQALLAALAALPEWSGAGSADPGAPEADSGQPTSIPSPSPQPAEHESAADAEPEPDPDVTEVENALEVDPVAGPEADSVTVSCEEPTDASGEEPGDPEWATLGAAPTVRRQPTEQPVALLASAAETSAEETEREDEPARVDRDAPDAHDDGPTRQSLDDMVSDLPDLDVEATVLAGDVTVRRSAADPPPAEAAEEAQTLEPVVGPSGRSRRRKLLWVAAATIGVLSIAAAGVGIAAANAAPTVRLVDGSIRLERGLVVGSSIIGESSAFVDVPVELLSDLTVSRLRGGIDVSSRETEEDIRTRLTSEGRPKVPTFDVSRQAWPSGNIVSFSWGIPDVRPGVRTVLTDSAGRAVAGCPSVLTVAGSCTTEAPWATLNVYFIRAVHGNATQESSGAAKTDDEPKLTAQAAGTDKYSDGFTYCRVDLRAFGMKPNSKQGYTVDIAWRSGEVNHYEYSGDKGFSVDSSGRINGNHGAGRPGQPLKATYSMNGLSATVDLSGCR